MLDFVTTATDGVPAQAGNLNHGLDAAPASLQSEQAGKPPAVLLVQRYQHPIDCAVLVGLTAVRMLLALWTGAHMNSPSSLFLHDHSLRPASQSRHTLAYRRQVSLHQNRQVVF
jgi:hypothetical protein